MGRVVQFTLKMIDGLTKDDFMHEMNKAWTEMPHNQIREYNIIRVCGGNNISQHGYRLKTLNTFHCSN